MEVVESAKLWRFFCFVTASQTASSTMKITNTGAKTTLITSIFSSVVGSECRVPNTLLLYGTLERTNEMRSRKSDIRAVECCCLSIVRVGVAPVAAAVGKCCGCASH